VRGGFRIRAEPARGAAERDGGHAGEKISRQSARRLRESRDDGRSAGSRAVVRQHASHRRRQRARGSRTGCARAPHGAPGRRTRMPPRAAVTMTAAFAVALGALAWLAPLPDRVTDRDVYEATAARGIVPDCTDLHCFRVLVPWMLGPLPGPSIVKWRAYAAVS